MPSTKVSQVKHEIFNRIIPVLERRGDRESFSVVKKTEDNPRRVGLPEPSMSPSCRQASAGLMASSIPSHSV